MQSSKLVDFAIHDEAALDDASRILHDAVFFADSWSHDRTNRCFRLPLWREMPGVRKYDKLFLCVSRVSFKRAACELAIHQVNDVAVRVTDQLDCYSLFRMVYLRDRSLLVFQTEGAVSVELSIDSLDGRLFDTGETTWKQHGYSFLSWAKQL